MPELPEVQTIVDDLNGVLPGLKISDVWSGHKKMIKYPASFAGFKKEIVGEKIIRAERRGKNILIYLSHDKLLLVHQKMTGHLLYGKFQITNSKNQTNSKAHLPDGKAGIPKTKENTEKKESWVAVGRGPLRDDPENRFIHLIFNLSNKKSLALCDMRKFAKVMAGPTDKILKSGGINKLGVDPFDKKFTFEYFKNAIGVKRKNIKTALMEQNLVAGIGNIYSDEILWLAGIHPLRTANTLSEKELKKIYESIKPVFKRALKARGSSYVDYRDAFGRKGKYQEMHYAYQRNGEKCQKKDGGILKKIKVGSRSAHFCPKHQK